VRVRDWVREWDSTSRVRKRVVRLLLHFMLVNVAVPFAPIVLWLVSGRDDGVGPILVSFFSLVQCAGAASRLFLLPLEGTQQVVAVVLGVVPTLWCGTLYLGFYFELAWMPVGAEFVAFGIALVMILTSAWSIIRSCRPS